VPKVGIEPSSAGVDQRQTAPNRMIGDPADAPFSASRCTIPSVVDDSAERGRLPPDAFVGVVETALAQALTLAAEAGRWEIVAQLTDELAARQRARERLPWSSSGNG